MGAVLVGAGAVVVALGIVGIFVGGRLLGRARAVPRVQVPARLVSRYSVLAGDMMTLEFPGPDGAPRQAGVFAAFRQGVGATPMFSGWVYVNPQDLTDVKTRPQGKVGPGWTVLIVGIVLTVLGALTAVAGVIVAAVDGIGSGPIAS